MVVGITVTVAMAEEDLHQHHHPLQAAVDIHLQDMAAAEADLQDTAAEADLQDTAAEADLQDTAAEEDLLHR